jgi:hypothetical protein
VSGKDAAGVETGIEMRGVGRQHDLAAPRIHAHALQPLRVAADVVHGNAGRDLARAAVELDPAGEHFAHHGDHVLDLERHARRHVA